MVSGRLLRQGIRWTDLSAEEFYAVVYTFMVDEAGSRERLEELLTEWVTERHMLSASSATEVIYTQDQADRIALSLLNRTE